MEIMYQSMQTTINAVRHGLPAPIADSSDSDPRSKYRSEDWRQFRVPLFRDRNWWTWEHGIIDLRVMYTMSERAAEGTRLREAVKGCRWVIKRHPCEFKIGMARELGVRWSQYLENAEDKWCPTHLFLLAEVRGREAVGYLESALIALVADLDVDEELNRNLQTRDRGGTGPRPPELLDHQYYVYLAVKADAT